MSGSLRKRANGVWLLRVSTGKDPSTGKYRQATKTFRGNKADAKTALDAFATEVVEGKHALTSATLATVLKRWLAYASDDLSPTTLHRYTDIIDRHVVPAVGGIPITRLRPSQLNDFYAALRTEKKQKPATVRQTHAVIRRALEFAVEEEWIHRNPAAAARPGKVSQHEVNPPTVAQVIALADSVRETNPELATFVFLSAMLGTRRGETCGLRWADIDFQGRTVNVQRAVIEVDHVLSVKSPKNTKSKRRFHIEDAIAQALTLHHAAMTERAKTLGTALADTAYVFSDSPDQGVPWAPNRVSEQFRNLCKWAGVSGVRLHDLRHFSVAYEVAQGIDIKTVATRHGHVDPSMTLRVYAAFLDPTDQKAAVLKGELLSKTPTP